LGVEFLQNFPWNFVTFKRSFSAEFLMEKFRQISLARKTGAKVGRLGRQPRVSVNLGSQPHLGFSSFHLNGANLYSFLRKNRRFDVIIGKSRLIYKDVCKIKTSNQRAILNFTPGPQGLNMSPRGNVHPFGTLSTI
jgi:hypothetical protein